MTGLLLVVWLVALVAGIAVAVAGMIRESGTFVAKSIPVFVLAVGLFLFYLSFTEVPTGYRAVVTRFGNVSRSLAPGPHLVMPFADSVHPISVQTMTVKPSEDAASHDLQVVHTQVTLAYHFDPEYVAYIYSQLSDASENAVENKVIVPAILEGIKSRTAQYDAQALISSRPAVRDGIESFLIERLRPYHVIPETVSITDFNFSKEFNDSIEAKVTAQQQAEKATNDLTRIKVEAQQKIAQAQAEAQSLQVQRQQITPELLQLRTIEMLSKKWDGKLPDVIMGGQGALPMLDVLKAKK